MPPRKHHAIDLHRDQLHASGWSIREIHHPPIWVVEVTRDLVRILASAPTRAEALQLVADRAARHGPA